MKIKIYSCTEQKNFEKNKLNNFLMNYLGIGYLKSNCNADIEVIRDEKNLKDCDLIALSSFFDTFGIKKSIDILNSTKIPVIIGGPISQWNELKKYDFKHIVKGEGELALQSIVDGNEEEKIISKPPIENLDTLNFPDRGVCEDHAFMITSRGCFNSCSFCGAHSFWKKYRVHSPEYIIEEVKHILKLYPRVKLLYIDDNSFICSKERFFKIYNMWINNGFHNQLQFIPSIRSDIFDEEMAKAMKKMNCLYAAVGIESGSDRILDFINKKTTVEINQRMIDICYSEGLPIQCNFIKNFPGETKKEKLETVKFIMKNLKKMQQFYLFPFMPYPGTELYNNENLYKTNIKYKATLYSAKGFFKIDNKM